MTNLDPNSARIGVIDGKQYPMLDEVGTGKTFARLAAVLPSYTDPTSIASRNELLAFEPEFIESTGDTRGWYVPVDKLHKAA